VRPNEWRLSCSAERERSQTECYHTARRMFSEPGATGADSFKRVLGRTPKAMRLFDGVHFLASAGP
jgi:hypothetical protein